MRYLFMLFTISFLFSSCIREIEEYDNENRLIKSYSLNSQMNFDGTYKTFYENGNLEIVKHYKDGVLMDSVILYNPDRSINQVQFPLDSDSMLYKNYQHNVLASEGKFYKDMKIGKWKYFKADGNLDKVIEYVDVCGSQYTNQGWYFKNGKDTLKNLGNYYNFKIPARVVQNEPFKFTIYHKPIIAANPNVLLCIGNGVDKSYCNIEQTKIDTIYGVNNTISLEIIFSTKGDKNLRGFIEEYYALKDSSASRLIYIDIPIHVE